MFVVNVEAAIYDDNHWLFIKRSEQEEHAARQLAFVGGRVEAGARANDVLEQTLHREVMEEIGVQVKNLQYVNSTLFFADNGTPVVDIVYVCELASGIPYEKSNKEVKAVLWLSTSDLLDTAKAPEFLKKNVRQADSIRKQVG
ncbi:MutT/Nudix family protein [Geomicrobium sp. JCM 19037]|uniref:NUDIX hydrolase n=1 Tax=Geomicrobium sp. JCM 19037 TaxID=1460634 RepID=UPI00045F1570|nr:NUDIX domain-containing protein [Geomicrobium sp. JCM 19037]GAK01832.1 MutT/Nudix family protein [Geomicrobium sp. JCM 19037]